MSPSLRGPAVAPSPLAEKIADGVSLAMPLAQTLFEQLAQRTAGGDGVTRDSYGRGEQIAHDLCTEAARSLGLEISRDPAGNLYMTLPGKDRDLPAWYVGSHLDSVLHGGNFDGAAGVVAGLAAIAALQAQKIAIQRDIVVMGVRAEECSTWFVGHHGGHLGSRAALGLLWPGELDSAVHVRTGKSLAASMDDAGFNSAYFRGNHAPFLRPEAIRGYLELHIEQGPVLEHLAIPVGVVTGIRGCLRARSAKTLGAYTHSGAVPHDLRRDAVLATVEFAHRIDDIWSAMRDAGRDMVFTMGKFFTDAEHHSIVKVPGEVSFAFDIRSQDIGALEEMRDAVAGLAEDVGRRRNVTIDLGEMSLVKPAAMDDEFRAAMTRGCAALSIPCMDIPSGAGHDAADFHDAGIRAAMIFIRNDHGSHNPQEAMRLEDFALGTKLLTWSLAAMD